VKLLDDPLDDEVDDDVSLKRTASFSSRFSQNSSIHDPSGFSQFQYNHVDCVGQCGRPGFRSFKTTAEPAAWPASRYTVMTSGRPRPIAQVKKCGRPFLGGLAGNSNPTAARRADEGAL